MRRSQFGFTLIELMATVAISAILIAIVYPAYTDHLAHADRNRAVVALMQLSARLEIYFSDNDSYDGATIRNLHADDLVRNLDYRLRIDSESDSRYTISAVPLGAQKKRDKQCGTLSLTSTNTRIASGDAGAVQCWM